MEKNGVGGAKLEKNFETEVLTRLAVIESKLDGYKELKSVSYEANNRSKQNEQDIIDIKENNKWLKRTVVSEVIGLIFLAISILIGLK